MNDRIWRAPNGRRYVVSMEPGPEGTLRLGLSTPEGEHLGTYGTVAQEQPTYPEIRMAWLELQRRSRAEGGIAARLGIPALKLVGTPKPAGAR